MAFHNYTKEMKIQAVAITKKYVLPQRHQEYVIHKKFNLNNLIT